MNGFVCVDEGYHLRPTNLHLSFYYINKSDSAGFFLSAFLRRPVCRLHEMFPFYLPHCAICIVYCITKIMLCIIAKPVECWSVPIFCSMSSFCKHLYLCYENKIAMLFSRVEWFAKKWILCWKFVILFLNMKEDLPKRRRKKKCDTFYFTVYPQNEIQ